MEEGYVSLRSLIVCTHSKLTAWANTYIIESRLLVAALKNGRTFVEKERTLLNFAYFSVALWKIKST